MSTVKPSQVVYQDPFYYLGTPPPSASYKASLTKEVRAAQSQINQQIGREATVQQAVQNLNNVEAMVRADPTKQNQSLLDAAEGHLHSVEKAALLAFAGSNPEPGTMGGIASLEALAMGSDFLLTASGGLVNKYQAEADAGFTPSHTPTGTTEIVPFETESLNPGVNYPIPDAIELTFPK